MTRRIPDLMLERYVLGELDEATRRQIDARVDVDAELAERVDRIRASDAEVLARMPARVFAVAVEQRAASQSPVRKGFRWAVLAPLLVAAAAMMVAIPAYRGLSSPGTEVVRAKGDPMVFVHRQGTADPEKLRDGGAARRGDVLQISYTASGAEFGAIASVDGRGTLTWHLPGNGRNAVRLQGGAGVPLDHAYELDDAPDFERFVFITGPDRFELDDLSQVLHSWSGRGPLELDPPLRSTVFSVSKEEEP